jgi:hypothetical protein
MEIIRGSHDESMGPNHRFRFKGDGLKVMMNSRAEGSRLIAVTPSSKEGRDNPPRPPFFKGGSGGIIGDGQTIRENP